MASGVLLAINCQEDKLYEHRHLIFAMYSDRFDRIAFLVNDTCELDPSFTNIVTPWKPPPYSPGRACPCGDAHYGAHAVDVHQKHPRLADLAHAAEGYEAVIFADTDCILSPALTAEAIRRRCTEFDAIVPPIQHWPRGDGSWYWSVHEAGYSSLDRMIHYLDRDRLLRHWRQFRGLPLIPEPSPPLLPMFCGFSDWLAFDAMFLRRIARDFVAMQQVWHEAAIPTAILHGTSRIQVARCQVLWGPDRELPLAELMARARHHDFVHPIKFGHHGNNLVKYYFDCQNYGSIL